MIILQVSLEIWKLVRKGICEWVLKLKSYLEFYEDDMVYTQNWMTKIASITYGSIRFSGHSIRSMLFLRRTPSFYPWHRTNGPLYRTRPLTSSSCSWTVPPSAGNSWASCYRASQPADTWGWADQLAKYPQLWWLTWGCSSPERVEWRDSPCCCCIGSPQVPGRQPSVQPWYRSQTLCLPRVCHHFAQELCSNRSLRQSRVRLRLLRSKRIIDIVLAKLEVQLNLISPGGFGSSKPGGGHIPFSQQISI